MITGLFFALSRFIDELAGHVLGCKREHQHAGTGVLDFVLNVRIVLYPG